MARILHINASPRADSYSLRLGVAFLDGYRQSHPDAGIETLNLFDIKLPLFDAPAAAAKYAVLAGQEPQNPDQARWREVIEVIRQFASGDLYVFSVPMWNYSIPYRLKQYIDIIVQPGLTFKYTQEKGYEGLVTGRPAVLMLAKGGSYPADTPMGAFDFQKPYMETILKFIGFADIRSLSVEQTLMAPKEAQQQLIDQSEEARKLGRSM